MTKYLPYILILPLIAFLTFTHWPVNYERMQNSTVRLVIMNEDQPIGLCSGVYLGEGKILTAGHCHKDGTHLKIETLGGETYEGKWVSHEFDLSDNFIVNDLALLETDNLPIDAAHTACDPLSPGTDVYAVGMPRGLKWTVTKGSVTTTEARNEEIEGLWTQMDISIMKGNSGGPIFDRWGNLVGIMSHVLSSGRTRFSQISSPHAYAVSPKTTCDYLNEQ